MLVEMITRRRPGKAGFLERHPRTKFQLDMEQLDEAIPEDCPESFSECCKQCLAYEADERLDSDSMLEWLSELYEELDGDESAPAPTEILGKASIGTSDHAAAQKQAAQDAVAAAMAAQGGGGPKLPAPKLPGAKPFKPPAALGGISEAEEEDA